MSSGSDLYGTRQDQIDPFFKAKRPWSVVKDKVLEDYVVCYLKTIPHRGRPILIVDAFAGPGRFGDGAKGSPILICEAIDKTIKGGTKARCVFADSRHRHRLELESNLSKHVGKGIVGRPLDDFEAALNHGLEIGRGDTLFFYFDPYGIKDLKFNTLRRVYERWEVQSTEVLLNFNFRTFMRMSGNWSYSDSASEVAKKVKQAKTETVNEVMDGDYWLPIVTDPGLGKVQREDAVMAEYVSRIKRFFTYVYSIPVKEEDPYGLIPRDELARYHLIFGTRSARAVTYMNDVALNALEPYLSQFKDGLLIDLTPQRFAPAPEAIVKTAIMETVGDGALVRPEIYERVVPKYFMQRRKKDYRALIDELTFAEGRLFPDRGAMRQQRRLNDETRLASRPWPDSASRA